MRTAIPHRHAELLSRDHGHHATCAQVIGDCMCNLCRQAFLELRLMRQAFHKLDKLAETSDLSLVSR